MQIVLVVKVMMLNSDFSCLLHIYVKLVQVFFKPFSVAFIFMSLLVKSHVFMIAITNVSKSYLNNFSFGNVIMLL